MLPSPRRRCCQQWFPRPSEVLYTKCKGNSTYVKCGDFSKHFCFEKQQQCLPSRMEFYQQLQENFNVTITTDFDCSQPDSRMWGGGVRHFRDLKKTATKVVNKEGRNPHSTLYHHGSAGCRPTILSVPGWFPFSILFIKNTALLQKKTEHNSITTKNQPGEHRLCSTLLNFCQAFELVKHDGLLVRQVHG